MVRAKYGASTTWMGKLLYRIEAGRAGDRPVLAVGIRKGAITDWPALVEANPIAAVGGAEDNNPHFPFDLDGD
jgi:CRISPR-associated protein Csd2